MPAKIDYTGQKFGLLTAVHPSGKRGAHIVWHFVCDCGNECDKVIAWITRSKRHGVPSCGCITKQLYINAQKKEFRVSDHPLYSTWCSMRTRCTNPNCKAWRFYGARGITVCERWNSFSSFVEDMFPSYVKGKTLDRINSSLGYSPDNCRRATPKEQARNTRRNVVVNGKCLRQHAEELGISSSTLYSRYHRGVRGDNLLKLRNKDGYQ